VEPKGPEVVYFPCEADKVARLLAAGDDTESAAQPQQLFRRAPLYPDSVRAQALSGWVEVQYTVDADGHVCDAWVSQSEPAFVFDGSALESLKSWRFEPPRLGGTAIAVSGLRARLEFAPPASEP
jgi:protein TonB